MRRVLRATNVAGDDRAATKKRKRRKKKHRVESVAVGRLYGKRRTGGLLLALAAVACAVAGLFAAPVVQLLVGFGAAVLAVISLVLQTAAQGLVGAELNPAAGSVTLYGNGGDVVEIPGSTIERATAKTRETHSGEGRPSMHRSDFFATSRPVLGACKIEVRFRGLNRCPLPSPGRPPDSAVLVSFRKLGPRPVGTFLGGQDRPL